MEYLGIIYRGNVKCAQFGTPCPSFGWPSNTKEERGRDGRGGEEAKNGPGFLADFCSHKGFNSKHPCILCEGERGQLTKEIVNPRPTGILRLGRSMKGLPLMRISFECFVPSPFHCLHGAATLLLKLWAEKHGDDKLAEICRKAGAHRHPRTMEFTGYEFLRK